MVRTLPILLVLFATCWKVQAVEVSRVLKTFDFEERELGNDEAIPMNWSKVTGPGLPHYVNGQLATDRQHGGRYSFRFDLNGGGLIYRYTPGLIKVQNGAHYRIDAFCQTTPLPNARARITAYFVDIDGNLLETTTCHSELYAATTDGGLWKKLTLSMSCDSPHADSMVLQLEVLQPSQYETWTSTARPLFEQDIRGSVWWDDITVSQVPIVVMRTDHPANIFRRNEPIRIAVRVSDRTTEDLVARMAVHDATGIQVYQRTCAPELLRPDPSEPQQKRMLLDLPPQEPGWYSVRLAMSSQGHPLDSDTMNLIVLADAERRAPPDPRFGFIATDLPFDVLPQLPGILPALSAGRIKLALWSEQGGVEPSNSADFDRLLTRFGELGIAPTACLVSPPSRLTKQLDGGGWGKLMRLKTSEWQPDLAFLVSRHANHLDSWQIGRDGTDAFVVDPATRKVYQAVYREFSQLVSDPDLAMPWPASYDLAGDLPASIALSVPPSVLPSQLPLYIHDFSGRTDHSISLSLQPLDRKKYGQDVQASDLAKRIIYALSADAKRIDLPLPVVASHDDLGASLQPDQLLIVIRTLLTTLSGTRYKGRIEFGEGIEAFLFDRNGEGLLALWSKGDTAGMKHLALNMGDRPVSIDLWGNATPLLRPPGEPLGQLSMNIGPTPTFLFDIDGVQAQLRASVGMDQPVLESSFRPHTRRIRFVNPYPHPISGTLRLKGPQGWTLNPPMFDFNLNTGETFDQSVTIEFPYNTSAGTKLLRCDFLLNGEKNPKFTVPLLLQLGLSDIGMRTIAVRDGTDIFVEQTITNYGDHPITYSAFAMYPDQPRQERLVVNLAPGATTIRKYRFTNVSRIQQGMVRVGLKELQGERLLNDSIEVQ